MNAYLGVVILEPTKKEEENGGVAKIVAGPVAVLGRDEGHAQTKVLREVPEVHANKDERLVVRLLSFR